MKKIFTSLFLFGILTFTYSFASASYSEELQDAYDFAYEKGITTMNSIEQADMGGSLTRIAMAKMISQYAINILGKTPDTSKECVFSDVDTKLDESYNQGVTLSCQLGLMGKGGKKFNPHNTVTRAELGTVLSRLLYGLEDGEIKYYTPHLTKLKEEGIINNDDPDLQEQRGYFMLMLMRSELLSFVKEDYSQKNLPKNMIPISYGKRFYFYDDYDNPPLSKAMKEMHLRSTYCPYIFCQRENEQGEYVDLKHYYRDENNEEMIILTGVTYVSNCAYYDNLMRRKENVIQNPEQALQAMLKELNMEEERKNMEMTSCTFWNDTFDRYYCSFIYQNKSFISWIKASNGTFIPLTIIKDGSGGQTDDKNGKKVIIQNVISSQQQEEEIKNLVERYYHFDARNRGVWTLGEVDTNTLIVYADDERELYMDRETKKKINSSENILSILEKDSGVFKDIIADQCNYNYIYHQKWDYGKNNEILFVYNFKYQGIQYQYKINPLNGEIIESKKIDIYDESSYSSDKTYTAYNIMDEVNQLLNTAPVRGDKKGRFVIIEYTELLCPYCQRQSQQGIINQVIDKFPGEIASVSQHYLIHGTPALRLAAAMECVAETNPKVYHQVMEEAFETNNLDVPTLEEIAENHGVNVATMDTCYQEGKYISKVYDMSNMGSTLFGVSGTPSNVIIDKETGKYEIVAGAYPVDEFVNVINNMKNS